MSIYCMSDIHGEYERYIDMLKHINFSDEDTLYIIGDVIDRGKRGVDILLDIMNRKNVHLLMGNHERMCIDELGPISVFGGRQLWQSNGGGVTRSDLLYKRTPSERSKIIRYLFKLPDYMEITVNGRDFVLVHGYPSDDPFERIWERPKPDNEEPIPGKTVIVGHTPTVFLKGESQEPYSIWYGNGIIDIDCGCGHLSEQRRLACLRLDDMQEFYI